MIYLDHAASTPLASSAIEIVSSNWKSYFANPTARHTLGASSSDSIEQAREIILTELGDSKGHLCFTSSATESNNTVIMGLNLQSGDEVIYSPADHPSVTVPLEYLAQEKGIKLIPMPGTDDGRVDGESLVKLLGAKVKLVVVTLVNNTSGHIYPAQAIANLVKKNAPHVHLHLDAAQGFTKVALDLSDQFIDSVALSGHKMGGPCGISALYYGNKVKITPLLRGGGHEYGMRASTPATVLINAFAAAVQEASAKREEEYQRILKLKEQVCARLEEALGENAIFPFAGSDISPYILTILFPRIAGDMLLRYLERDEIYLSTTSACSGRNRGPNPALGYLGVDEKLHNSVVRCSFGVSSNQEECDEFCTTLIEHHGRLYYLTAGA